VPGSRGAASAVASAGGRSTVTRAELMREVRRVARRPRVR
jgi:hypothetical protein